MTAVIRSHHTGPLGLPGGPVIEPGKTVKVEVQGYARFLRLHAVGRAWLDAGVIEIVEGEEQPTAPAPVPSDSHQSGGGDEQPKTAAEVLAMADTVHFMTFKVEAAKLLGPDLPAKKAEIVALLEELANKLE